MSASAYKRLTRYAALALLQLVVVAVALLAGLDEAALIILVVSVPLVFAWGHYQADVALNPRLDASERYRWRLILSVIPWSLVWYWHSQVRPRRVPE